VAVKTLHAPAMSGGDRTARARFNREVMAARRVASFCTAQILDADVDGRIPYVVSEFVDGPSLSSMITDEGTLAGPDLDRLAINTVTALAAIHEAGIVHRDFKPANVLMAQDGPRVVDFGIARAADGQESAITGTGMVVGTPAYLAPEQLTGAPPTPAVDLFAWGATMVFAATGRSPFEAGSIPAVFNRVLNEHPDLSVFEEPLRRLVARCLAKDAAQRPAAHELLLALLGHDGDEPVPHAVLGAAPRFEFPAPPPYPQRNVSPFTPQQPQAVRFPPSPPQPSPPGDGSAPARQVAATVQSAPRSSSRAVALMGALAVLVLVVGASVGAYALTRTPDPGPHPTIAPSQGIPGSYAGTWSGTVNQTRPTVATWQARLKLTQGRAVGTIDYLGKSCSGTVSVVNTAGGKLVLQQSGTDSCMQAGYLTLSNLGGSVRIDYNEYLNGASPTATGILTEQ
jgi:serine/threonine protein kinase